ncbi:hypothetical protein D2A34_24720 [Clostridium chromiireducens]|uniref:Uncharacterized protein n=1 Tax=Clostridium chromiireducens TaxID=225345 RepID=A0A399IMD1_9CLOT|nr:hypothetical protein [Clostridium chromiireducens]RII32126.1 hypothetical protein D2A34_24720 [Clostridium chromiireducens]
MDKDELKIKHIELKLHFTYCGIIASIIGICLFTVRNYSNSDMAVQFSFGATLVGIVLSVIAIFMSIVGEKEMSSTKDKLVSASDDLVKIKNELNKSIESISQIISIKDELIQGNKTIMDKLDNSFELLNKNENNIENNDINYIEVYKDTFDNLIADIKTNSLGILYFYKEYYDVKKEFMRSSHMVKIIVNEFHMSNEEIVGGLLIGMSSIFFPQVINNNKFRNYIVEEISKNIACKSQIDEYLKRAI